MITRELNSYRLPFFESARALLVAESIVFDVLVGGATADDRAKRDPAVMGWAQEIPTHNHSAFGQSVWWQPVLREARHYDLIVTEQASKQLTNIPLAVMQRLGQTRHCLWGHGKNFQSEIEGVRGEGLKRLFTSGAHWFFSYTEASTRTLLDQGFPADRITTFNNSTDVRGIRRALSTLDSDHRLQTRNRFGFEDGPVVGYLGALYPPKRTRFLVEALAALRLEVPNVSAMIIGGGSEEAEVADFARINPWVYHAGATYGPERIELAACSDLLLMPGLVGLNIVDGFAMGLPLITTDIEYHSPEISYLRHGQNGWICPSNTTPAEYAKQIAAILSDQALLDRLRRGAIASGDDLGTEAMAEKFSAGVLKALAAPQRGGLTPIAVS